MSQLKEHQWLQHLDFYRNLIRLLHPRPPLEKKSKEIEESEKKYKLLFNEMSSGFALHKMIYNDEGKPVDYRFLEINKAFEGLTGLKREKILNKTVLEVIPDLESFWIEKYGQLV